MQIAIDTGGTFTDCVYLSNGRLEVLKLPSTPANPAEAVLQAVSQISAGEPAEVRHGTTVATNALLERKGARAAFVTTTGFEDTLDIGRQARPKLYDLFFAKDPPLAPAELRFGIKERISSDGVVLQAIEEPDLRRLIESIRAQRPESIAISLLFAFANPIHERALAAALRPLGVPISLSHEILPEFREYERGSTVLINAYLAPKMQSYLDHLDRRLQSQASTLNVMQSSGGIIPASIAAREPVRTILSGPAGGVVGALAVARAAGFPRILAFDMGGTSTDVALVETATGLRATSEFQIMGMPVAVPVLDIHTVGAGGGSIASFDRGGALKVGPESAGADPGPLCYGRGEMPTVTDANLLLGRLDPHRFLGGAMHLDLERAREYFARTKGPLATVEQFAEGILRLADSRMEKALRRISVEQGHDPRDFVLLSFGGAGPLHACALARALSIPKVLVPNHPGALSAYGILVSDTVRDYSRTVMLSPDDASIARCVAELARNRDGDVALSSLDVRYRGQGYELNVPWTPDFVESFHRLHQQRYGYADRARPVEVVNVRVRMVSINEPVEPPRETLRPGDGSHALVRSTPAGRLYSREKLHAGDRFSGPALIVEYSAATFVPEGAVVSLDEFANLVIEV
ncbi:MAG: hydantoinase/oxoprolinase family protein [Acidobacteriaceae bacterium]|nr:hydantoinase/oxoprolinase family protein [Acidobacteriaceae bacterium]